jgi:hypothetical protein
MSSCFMRLPRPVVEAAPAKNNPGGSVPGGAPARGRGGDILIKSGKSDKKAPTELEEAILMGSVEALSKENWGQHSLNSGLT